VLRVAWIESVVSEGAEGPVAGPGHSSNCGKKDYLDKGKESVKVPMVMREGQSHNCFPGNRFNEAVDDLSHCSG
jgi:hypothetical protein